ncbi:MAG: fimbria/pilus periplasmic chaperone [Candidatus Binataceae bacterium]
MYQSTSNPREGRAGFLSVVMNIVRHRPHHRRPIARGLKIAAACWLLIALGGIASAATFSIDPVQVYLSGRDTSQTLTLHYDGTGPSRFQVAAYAWDQSADGAEVLTPTKDIFFFPVLLTMKPGEEHKLRVSRAVLPAIAEKTYRLYIEQLPPPQVASKPAEVRFVTRMSLPVFVEPVNGSAQGKIDNITLANGKLSLSIENTGNVHLKANTIRVIGRSDAEQPFTRQTSGWYVLAGERRDYQLDIPAGDCRKIHTLSVEVETEQGAAGKTSAVKADFTPPPGSCGSQAQQGAT